jgi:pimeloyl-ACP methyl ester carboxylesterase
MGGMIAQELAIGYPERVKKLVLGCTFSREDEMGGHTSEYFKGLGVGKNCSDDELRRVSARRVLTTDFSLAFNNRLYSMIVCPLSWVYAILLPTNGIHAQFEAIVDHDTLDRLYKIEVPTLVITGTQDRIIRPSSTEVIASRIKNAKLVTVDGGPHALFVAMKGRFNREVLDFLRED